MVQIFHIDLLMALFPFAIQGPGHKGIGKNPHFFRAAEGNHSTFIFLSLHSLDTFGKLCQIPGCPHQQNLQLAIGQIHHIGAEGQNTTHRGRIADGAKEEVILHHLAVDFHADMFIFDLGQFTDAFQQIGCVSQGILDALGVV